MNNKFLTGILFLVMLFLAACSPAETVEVSTDEPVEDVSAYDGKRIVVVDSYHEGYEWSDGILVGVDSVLDETNVDTLLIRMDTKNNTDEVFREEAAQSAYEEIMAFDPDVIIACDDNAQKYLIVPHLIDSEIPVIFCGVNWDASGYGYPNEHITGMVEIELIAELVTYLESFANGDSIAMISGESTTDRQMHDVYNERFLDDSLESQFVTTWAEFQTAYIEIQTNYDFLIVRNNGGISDWPEEEEVIQFFLDNTTIPTGTINAWMAPYVLIVMGKSATEQGEWSATTALSILDGTPISDIPMVTNRKGDLILNLDMAEQLDIVFTPTLLRNAEIYQASED